MDSLLEALQSGLGGSFRIERELGGGGMSRVFLAQDKSLDRPVVVKVLSAEASEGTSADRFRREVQLIAKLQHPHIVPILSASQVDGMLYKDCSCGEPLY
jgi:eukaryotic-like serine/threonine-protein kinase